MKRDTVWSTFLSIVTIPLRAGFFVMGIVWFSSQHFKFYLRGRHSRKKYY